MNQKQKLDIFKAQTGNVRELNATWKHLNRIVNVALVDNKHQSGHVHTKLLALVYCALAEALFSKLIHTPFGFNFDEIAQIGVERRTNGIVEAWKRAVDLALRRVKGGKSGHLANVAKKLNDLVDEYVEGPSLIRNKIAHGQIRFALNRENTSLNSDLTRQIDLLDCVKLDYLLTGLKGLADIVEAIIESPQKGAFRDYWGLMEKVIDELYSKRNYTIKQKVTLLKHKKQVSSSKRESEKKKHS